MKAIFYTLCFSFFIIFYSCEESNNSPEANSGTAVTGYFQADGNFYKTTDAGDTWINKGSGHNIIDSDIKGISFVNDLTGFFQEEGHFWMTTNGGDTWTDKGNNGHVTDVDQISFVD